jgi:hypothetical protein
MRAKAQSDNRSHVHVLNTNKKLFKKSKRAPVQELTLKSIGISILSKVFSKKPDVSRNRRSFMQALKKSVLTRILLLKKTTDDFSDSIENQAKPVKNHASKRFSLAVLNQQFRSSFTSSKTPVDTDASFEYMKHYGKLQVLLRLIGDIYIAFVIIDRPISKLLHQTNSAVSTTVNRPNQTAFDGRPCLFDQGPT